MPPEKPSPHRFLPGTRRQQSPEKQTTPAVKRKPAPRPAALNHTSDPSSPLYAEPPRPVQFVATPRFTVGSSNVSIHADQSSSPPRTTLVRALRSTGRRTEEVEEATSFDTENDGERNDLHGPTARLSTTEPTSEHDHEWGNQLPYSPKRRRIEDGTDDDSSMATMQLSRTQHNIDISANSSARLGPRFTHAASSQAEHSSHPTFLRPTPAASELQDPLPDAFSPHRRGNKFVPGGMAAMLQQWVVETGQAAVQGRKGRGLHRGSDYIMKVQIEEAYGLAPLLVTAKDRDSVQVRLILIPSPNSTDIMSGSIIGVRDPIWEVNLLEQQWIVAVDWKALQ